jgi:hypothetical protein
MAALKPGLRAVLFDLDGTLLDSIPDLAEACHRMMVELGRPPHPETIRTFVGKGMLNLVRRCLEAGGGADEAEFDAAVDAFRRHYAVVNGDCTEVYPGVVPALAALAGRGVAMACVTNKPAAFTGPLLERMGWRRILRSPSAATPWPTRSPTRRRCSTPASARRGGGRGADGRRLGQRRRSRPRRRHAGAAGHLWLQRRRAGGQHRMRRATIEPRRNASAYRRLTQIADHPS